MPRDACSCTAEPKNAATACRSPQAAAASAPPSVQAASQYTARAAPRCNRSGEKRGSEARVSCGGECVGSWARGTRARQHASRARACVALVHTSSAPSSSVAAASRASRRLMTRKQHTRGRVSARSRLHCCTSPTATTTASPLKCGCRQPRASRCWHDDAPFSAPSPLCPTPRLAHSRRPRHAPHPAPRAARRRCAGGHARADQRTASALCCAARAGHDRCAQTQRRQLECREGAHDRSTGGPMSDGGVRSSSGTTKSLWLPVRERFNIRACEGAQLRRRCARCQAQRRGAAAVCACRRCARAGAQASAAAE